MAQHSSWADHIRPLPLSSHRHAFTQHAALGKGASWTPTVRPGSN